MRELSWRYRIVYAVYQLAFLLQIGGVFAALLGRRFGAYFAIGGMATSFTVHLTLGIAGYREVMGRPWPKVAPIVDDDDW